MNFIEIEQKLSVAKYSSKVRKLKTLIDKTVVYKRQRWAIASLVSAVVTFRALNLQFIAILYIAFLYLIYLIVLYFTPSGLPDPDEIVTSAQKVFSTIDQCFERLPSSICGRKYVSYVLGLGFALYWPFLLIYFFWLVGLAIQRHCHHMKVYNYSLRDFDRKTGVIEDF